MVTATVVKDSSGYVSFTCKGHAGFMKKGKDIVCSAISMLTVNTANSIMTLTDTGIDVREDDGFISWEFKEVPSYEAGLLMDSMIIGLRSVEEEYKGYLTVKIEEVSDVKVKPSVICS
ncbi:MAG: ribosomal-processing cysteine protease Prp [Lachnospiraceae bacterium]|nr:ribosomal-processing cysteine protease Prp [Lachnospiraceae bacterium]